MGIHDDDNNHQMQTSTSKKRTSSLKSKMGANQKYNQSDGSGDETTRSDRIQPIKSKGYVKKRTDKRKVMNSLNQNYDLYGVEEGVDKFLKDKTAEDKSMFLTKEEFVNIQFDLEWPLIMKDLA